MGISANLSADGLSFVIPANPGSGPGQAPESRKTAWIPACAGMTEENFDTTAGIQGAISE
jgi:hypothetical protein